MKAVNNRKNQLALLFDEIRKHGIRKAVQIHGWRIVVAIFVFYLVRDTLLYVLLPALFLGGI